MRTALQQSNHSEELLDVFGKVRSRINETMPAIPVFDLQESENHYVIAIDLPSAPISGTEIEVRDDLLQVLMNCQSEVEKRNILFRCQSKRNVIRAKYQNGVLWVLLPKEEIRISEELL